MQTFFKRLLKTVAGLMALGLILVLAWSMVPQQSNALAAAYVDRLTPDEKVDRAYQFRQGTGALEEEKQASANADALFNPKDKANLKNVKDSDTGTYPPTGLVEQTKDLIDQMTEVK